jgi:hypothetical protein
VSSSQENVSFSQEKQKLGYVAAVFGHPLYNKIAHFGVLTLTSSQSISYRPKKAITIPFHGYYTDMLLREATSLGVMSFNI